MQHVNSEDPVPLKDVAEQVGLLPKLDQLNGIAKLGLLSKLDLLDNIAKLAA